MKIGELLREDTILMNFRAADRWAAVATMVDHLVARGQIPADRRQAVVDAVVARENIASTGLENGIAIPHATVDGLENPAAAAAISPEGVAFAAADGKPSTIVVLLVIPRKSIQKHMRTLAAIAKLVESASMRDSLRTAATAADVLATIRRVEG